MARWVKWGTVMLTFLALAVVAVSTIAWAGVLQKAQNTVNEVREGWDQRRDDQLSWHARN
jgi:hypothetical protein